MTLIRLKRLFSSEIVEKMLKNDDWVKTYEQVVAAHIKTFAQHSAEESEKDHGKCQLQQAVA
jgi:spore germination protein GerM